MSLIKDDTLVYIIATTIISLLVTLIIVCVISETYEKTHTITTTNSYPFYKDADCKVGVN